MWKRIIAFQNVINSQKQTLLNGDTAICTFIEKNAQAHCATLMRTSDFDARNDEAITFFKNMLYEIDTSEYGLSASVKATKFFK